MTITAHPVDEAVDEARVSVLVDVNPPKMLVLVAQAYCFETAKLWPLPLPVVVAWIPYPSTPTERVAVALSAASGDFMRLSTADAYKPPAVLLPVSPMLKVQPNPLLEQAIVLETCGVEVVMAAAVNVPNSVVVVLTLQLIVVATVALTVTAEDVAAEVNSGEIPCLTKSPNQVNRTKTNTNPIADQKPASPFKFNLDIILFVVNYTFGFPIL